MNDDNGNLFYRFRPINRLLDESQELDRQEIYLSSPSELNDPMEGYKDLVWRGDAILWGNLFRHYVLTLLWNATECAIMDDKTFEEPPIPGLLSEDDLPTDGFRRLYCRACELFDAAIDASKLASALARMSSPVHIEGLRFVLTTIHLSALKAVVEAMGESKLLPSGWSALVATLPRTAKDPLEELANVQWENSELDFETLAFATNQVYEQGLWRVWLDDKYDPNSVAARRKDYLLLAFPTLYARTIADSTVHGSWHAACFSATCTNASVWSTYASNHTGAALVFRARTDDKEQPYLPLRAVTSVGGSSDATHYGRSTIHATLHKVDYTTRPPAIEFFQFLGMLPRNKLSKTWHSDSAGNRSPMVERIFQDERAWREDLWKSFYRIATTKLADWSHESEYRIVLPDWLHLRQGPERRKVTFELEDLHGVVFGLRTSSQDKAKIIRTIHAKGTEAAKHIRFYQIVFSEKRGQLIRA